MANKYELRRRALKEAHGRSDNPFASPRHGGETEALGYTPPPPMDRRGLTLALSLVLALVITALYVQTARHEFTVCDDNVYIYEKPQIVSGLTWDHVVWAFADAHEGNWHPLTWISHMLDFQLFSHGTWEPENLRYKDSWAGGHHLVSMGIHCVNAVLLFLALRLMTGTLWPSFVVAALFGIHPLRVESVAWAAERKDVLCGLFWMASMLAYAFYARRRPIRPTSLLVAISTAIIMGFLFALLVLVPNLKTDFTLLALLIGAVVVGMLIDAPVPSPLTRLPEIGGYLLTTLFLALGLMSKSMIVTLPCVFVLLDIWPLRRWQNALWPPARRDSSPDVGAMIWLVMEKIPWLAMAYLDSSVTVYGQQKGVALNSFEGLHLSDRLLNAVVSCGEYLRQTFWPTGLAPFYTHPAMIPDGWTRDFYVSFFIYAALLGAITLAVICLFFLKRQFLAVGWFWYLGTLIPVIGIIQVGTQARADRYTYLPMIGVYLMVAWLLKEVADRWPQARLVLAASSVAVLVALSAVTFRQVSYWVDSYKLFQHAAEVTDKNYFAYNHIGIAFDSDARKMTAGDAKNSQERFEYVSQYFDALPAHLDASLTQPLASAGSGDDLREAAGRLDRGQKQQLLFDYSADAFQTTIDIKPDYDFGNNNLGVYYARKSKQEDLALAEKYFTGALRSNQRYADAYNNLGIILLREGKLDEAIASHIAGLRVRDDRASDHNNLCRAYMRRRDLNIEKGNLDAAKSDLDEALRQNAISVKCDPNFLPAWMTGYDIYMKQKDPDTAAKCVQRMISIDARTQETIQVLMTFAANRLNTNRADDAIALLSQFLEVNDAVLDVYNARGVAYLQKGDFSRAKEDFEHVLRLAPQFPGIQERLNFIREKLAAPAAATPAR